MGVLCLALVLAFLPRVSALMQTWVGGSSVAGYRSVVAAAAFPRPRSAAVVWADGHHSVWMFGGRGDGGDKTSEHGGQSLADLWHYDVLQQKWSGVQGDQTQTWPSPRHLSAACGSTDVFVMFGGDGMPQRKTFNDTWIYNMTAGEWNVLVCEDGNKCPSARKDMSVWCLADTLVVYGGLDDSNMVLDDMWQLSLSALEWRQIPAAPKASQPEGRNGATTWHTNNTLYLFGGNSVNFTATDQHFGAGLKSDLWSYELSSKRWRHLKGPSQARHAGSFGKIGEPSESSNPGCRRGAVAWTQGDSKLWLFGGEGSADRAMDAFKLTQLLSDFWVFDVESNLWTWVGGLRIGDQAGSWGNVSLFDRDNQISPRVDAAVWHEGGIVKIFGGLGIDSRKDDGELCDIWVIDVVTAMPVVGLGPVRDLLMMMGFVFAFLFVVIAAFGVSRWVSRSPGVSKRKPKTHSDVQYSPLLDDVD